MKELSKEDKIKFIAMVLNVSVILTVQKLEEQKQELGYGDIQELIDIQYETARKEFFGIEKSEINELNCMKFELSIPILGKETHFTYFEFRQINDLAFDSEKCIHHVRKIEYEISFNTSDMEIIKKLDDFSMEQIPIIPVFLNGIEFNGLFEYKKIYASSSLGYDTMLLDEIEVNLKLVRIPQKGEYIVHDKTAIRKVE